MRRHYHYKAISIAMMPATMTYLHLVIVWLCLTIEVNGEVFERRTPFLVKPATVTDRVAIVLPRGGSDSVYESDDGTDEEAWNEEEDEYDEEVDDAILRDSNLSDFEDEEETEEEDFTQVEEIFEDENEDVFVDAQEEIFEDEEEEEQEPFEESSEDEEPVIFTTQVLEERLSTTDDEYSSAFVDRMELADAYDEGETTTAGDGSAALAAATTAVGGADEDAAQEEVEVEITEITDEMKSILQRELKYTPRDVKVLRADIASVVVAKRLRRPIEGMPPNWYVEGAKPSNGGLRQHVIKVSLTLAAVGTVVLLGLKGEDMGLDLDDVQDALKKFPAMLATMPAALQSATGRVKRSTVAALPAAASAVEEPPAAAAEQGETAAAEQGETDEKSEEDHPHSVKPGATHAPSYEEDLDKSILDKVITSIENVIKAFFRLKI
jgi:hypothetical protein